MEEPRQQAYLALIRQLLACRSPEELEPCLMANQELLDIGLVQSVIELSNLCEQEEEDQAAHSLNALAKLLANVLGLQVLTEVQWRERHSLLVKLLQASSESQADAGVVYPILQANLNILDQGFIQVLQKWMVDITAAADSGVTQTMTGVLAGFGQLIAAFPGGQPEINAEIARLISQ